MNIYMKCINKKEYDCFHLVKENVNDFVQWFKKFNYVYAYTVFNKEGYVNIAISNPYDKNFDRNRDSFDFNFDMWYVYKGGDFVYYNDKWFKEQYELVGDALG